MHRTNTFVLPVTTIPVTPSMSAPRTEPVIATRSAEKIPMASILLGLTTAFGLLALLHIGGQLQRGAAAMLAASSVISLAQALLDGRSTRLLGGLASVVGFSALAWYSLSAGPTLLFTGFWLQGASSLLTAQHRGGRMPSFWLVIPFGMALGLLW